MTHTMQPGVRPPDFNSLINGLLTTDAPLPRRLQTASTLRTVLCAPEHAAFVQRDSSQLLNALEQLLYDRTEPIRRQVPVLIGALAAAMRPNLHQFISWLLYTAQCATQNQQNLTLWPLVLLMMHEALEALVQARDTPCVLPYLPDLVRCMQTLLEGLDEAALTTALLPLLVSFSRAEYAQALLPHVSQVVDVLIGWSLEATSTPSVAAKVALRG